ncbi:hypothetical protein ERO13_A06G029500v2 [Gossypium hirsutum]|uniref:RING-type E3 ubiquitin transferase n=1 Tax=Gossypium hirsutum TaxID=3635 RepID=A0A1U8MXW6_GOSHI|nr:E3 ubiquitin-protein ligase WAV3 [Gossypium hirsutum]KAG4194006.1 hypothetical protein ERO13_A06G029500v2 [Gossypium hirsutum]
MATGWRRAFCTAIPREPETTDPSPKICAKLSFFSSGSNPSTPRLQPSSTNENTPKASNPSSPRSPLKLSLFRNSFKFRSTCGICLNSVKTGQGTAIYTAECSHAFHFPCIAAHVRKYDSLVCPVCNTTWKDVPLLSIHKNPRSINQPKPKPDLRSYDDDEPLLSPTAGGGRFVPIPEADEHEEESAGDVEEFQGFFVNPNPSSIEVHPFNGRDSRNVQVRLSPETAVVSVGRGYETYAVALKIKAPSRNTASFLDLSRRAPIDLVTLLDVSGSMNGGKLQMLKRAMRLVISSLGSADRLSIVAFSGSSKRLLPLRRMTAQGQRAARHIIDRLVCGQGTSVCDAFKKATKVLDDRRERNPVAGIILLSDGHDERGSNQRLRSSHVSSTRFAHIEIPVHSFGFGQTGGFSHDPAEDAFAKCISGIFSVVIQDLRIQLSFAPDSAPAEITAVYSCNGKPTVLTSGSVRLGDFYAEEERDLLVELKVPASALRSNHVMCVRCLYKDPISQEVVYGRDQSLLVPQPNAVRSPTPEIEQFRFFFITTRAIAESRRLIECGNDLTSAHHLLASARALLMQSNSLTVAEYVRGLEAELTELQRMKQQMVEIQRRRVNEREREREAIMVVMDENGEQLTPSSAWRTAEKLAKVAMMKKSLNKVSDLHGFENARF